VLECRHRQHAHVEDRIRDDKDTRLAKFPFKEFALNEVWVEIVMLAHDLIVWTQALVLDGELAKAAPKRLRYRNADLAVVPTLVGNLPQIGVIAAIEVGMTASEVFEEREQAVGWPVAAGAPVGACEAVECALFDRQVGLQVVVRRALLLVDPVAFCRDLLTSPQRDGGRVDAGDAFRTSPSVSTWCYVCGVSARLTAHSRRSLGRCCGAPRDPHRTPSPALPADGAPTVAAPLWSM